MAKMEGMKVVVNALVGATPSIANVLLVCLIFWLIFAIIGVNTFMGKYYKCLDLDTKQKFSHEIVPNKEVCLQMKANNESADWVNSFVTFDNVFMAYLALLQVKLLSMLILNMAHMEQSGFFRSPPGKVGSMS